MNDMLFDVNKYIPPLLCSEMFVFFSVVRDAREKNGRVKGFHATIFICVTHGGQRERGTTRGLISFSIMTYLTGIVSFLFLDIS